MQLCTSELNTCSLKPFPTSCYGAVHYLDFGGLLTIVFNTHREAQCGNLKEINASVAMDTGARSISLALIVFLYFFKPPPCFTWYRQWQNSIVLSSLATLY